MRAADVVGRPHFAQAMIAKGYVGNKREAFDRFLARGKPAYAERCRLGPEPARLP
jgi:predicted metal-dependent phosphoesterase TrpH